MTDTAGLSHVKIINGIRRMVIVTSNWPKDSRYSVTSKRRKISTKNPTANVDRNTVKPLATCEFQDLDCNTDCILFTKV